MDLKELLGEDLYNQVVEKAGDKHKVAVVSDGNWFPKEKFNEVNNAKKQLESDLEQRDKQLNDLKKNAGNKEELEQQIQKLQDDNKEAKEKYEKEANELKMNTALKLSLAGQVHDPDLVAGLIDKDSVQLDDNGEIKSGLDDQLKSLKENKGFLFVPEKEDQGATFTGMKTFDGKTQDTKGDETNFGKQLAEFNKQQNQGSKEEDPYFKN